MKMERKEYQQKYWDYIEEHRENVKKALALLVKWGIVDPKSNLYNDLRKNISIHDLSKINEKEFEPYAKYFFLEDGKSKYKDEFDRAWLHHIHSNPHHWNYWVLVDDGDKIVTALEMPKVYVYEMICDWLSFAVKKGDLSEVKSFYAKKRKEYIFHPKTRKLVEEIIEAIVKENEK